MLGLARLARLGLDDDGTFRSAAHRGADFLIESRRGKDRLPPDAWLMQALDVLYDDHPKPSYVEHALAIGRSMLADQYGEGCTAGLSRRLRPRADPLHQDDGAASRGWCPRTGWP